MLWQQIWLYKSKQNWRSWNLGIEIYTMLRSVCYENLEKIRNLSNPMFLVWSYNCYIGLADFASSNIAITMVNRKCCICQSTQCAFIIPKKFWLKKAWTNFLQENFPQVNVKDSTCVCYKHFETACFSNYNAWIEKRNNWQEGEQRPR